MKHLHTPQNTILLFYCVMTNLEVASSRRPFAVDRENDVHSTVMNVIFQQEEIASHSMKNRWPMNKNTKWNIFLFTSSGNKQKTTVHMKDAKKFNERVNDC